MTQSETSPGTTNRPVAPWRIGVDVGGTFTDLVLADAGGQAWVAKVPSVPSDPSAGVLSAVQRIAVDLGLPNLKFSVDAPYSFTVPLLRRTRCSKVKEQR